jgi:hypothetical protein
MRFFASGWERVRGGQWTSALVVAGVLATALSRVELIMKLLAGPAGNYWG